MLLFERFGSVGGLIVAGVSAGEPAAVTVVVDEVDPGVGLAESAASSGMALAFSSTSLAIFVASSCKLGMGFGFWKR
jgi:hypothetical protein